MKKSLSVSVIVIAVISICSVVYAFEGKGSGDRASKHELLSQLPADKEMLVHQTMREVREKTAEDRGQIKKLKKEILDVLTAPSFDEEMFLEKIRGMQILRQKERQTMIEGFAKMAKQYNQEERRILAAIIPLMHRHHGRHSTR